MKDVNFFSFIKLISIIFYIFYLFYIFNIILLLLCKIFIYLENFKNLIKFYWIEIVNYNFYKIFFI